VLHAVKKPSRKGRALRRSVDATSKRASFAYANLRTYMHF